MMKKRVSAVIFGFGMLALGASPALAHSATSPDGGSYVYNSGTTFSVKDAKCDNYAAYGYVNNTAHRQDNSQGCGTTLSKSGYGTITAVQACTNIPLASDPCSSWK
jgi:hypothetical protein